MNERFDRLKRELADVSQLVDNSPQPLPEPILVGSTPDTKYLAAVLDLLKDANVLAGGNILDASGQPWAAYSSGPIDIGSLLDEVDRIYQEIPDGGVLYYEYLTDTGAPHVVAIKRTLRDIGAISTIYRNGERYLIQGDGGETPF